MPLRLILSGLFMLSALGLGLVGYQIARPPKTVTIMAEAPTPPPPPPQLMADVLVASRSLPAGTLMKEEDLTQRAVPASEVPPGAVMNSPEARATLRGALSRQYIDAGSVLLMDAVLHPRDRGFLAAVLTPGSRAISVGVDAVTGNGGQIWPGDHVDVILTQELNEKDLPLARRFVGETVLNDVRVVAVDLNIIQGGVATGDGAGRLARTVTMEVTAQQAERAAVAERLGKLTLAIRAADEAAGSTTQRTSTYGGDVSAALGNGATSATAHMRVMRGKEIQEVTFP